MTKCVISISSLPSCTLQGCILCSHVRIEDRVTLKDCFVGANFTVTKEGKLTWALAQCFKPHDVPSPRLLSFLCACKESLYYGLLLILDCVPGNSVMYKMNTSVISSSSFTFLSHHSTYHTCAPCSWYSWRDTGSRRGTALLVQYNRGTFNQFPNQSCMLTFTLIDSEVPTTLTTGIEMYMNYTNW